MNSNCMITLLALVAAMSALSGAEPSSGAGAPVAADAICITVPWKGPGVVVTPAEEKTPDGESALRITIAPGTPKLTILVADNQIIAPLVGSGRNWESMSVWVQSDDSGAGLDVVFQSKDKGNPYHVLKAKMAGTGWKKVEATTLWSKAGGRLILADILAFSLHISPREGGCSFLVGPLSVKTRAGADRSATPSQGGKP